MQKNMEIELETGFIDYQYCGPGCILSFSRVPPTDLVSNYIVHSDERSSKFLVC